MVGNKFLQDDGEEDEVISSEWAASGGLDVKQLNKLELEFLDAMVSFTTQSTYFSSFITIMWTVKIY